MTQTPPLELETDGVLAFLGAFDALRTWEFLRSARTAVTIAELVQATGVDRRLLQEHVDVLGRFGLVESVRARKPRKSIGYRVTTERIVVTFDDARPESAARAIASSDTVVREFERCIAQHADSTFHSIAGVRFRHHSIQHFTAEDFAELRRRVLALIEFLAAPRPRPPQPRCMDADSLVPPAFCNQAISIRLDPIAGRLLPLPSVWMTPRSKLERSTVSEVDKTGLAALAPREREVALALADGLTRAHVAVRMQLSVHTVATLARRVYRKLGVSSQAALAARLAGHTRRKLGER